MAQTLPSGVIRTMRPHQWVKNVLVFAAPIAAGITEIDKLSRAVLAFVCFCLAASATYLLNDVRDVESDRRHPIKHKRPVAAGVVPVKVAVGVAIVLLAASLALASLVNVGLLLTMIAYLALQAGYVYWLKFQPVLDVVAVASGYVLRTIAGAAAAQVPISPWFFVVTSFGALLMVAGKREGEASELDDDAAGIRSTLGVYTPTYLTYLRSVSSGVVLVAYFLWAFESANMPPATLAGLAPGKPVSDVSSVLFRISIVPFVIAILRYALLLDQGEGSEPERLVMRDRTLQVSGVIWGIIYASGVYLTSR
ncbi:MAG: decaprenyl-phosphate phosphoribosyltransferase [Actinobacteria bacterium]|nr:decaprenyl-phosphate phosphoribosyltransferase [Actinomycetota bacterium]